ncbi:hypothetical protein VM1G_01254 [Cytospora mali]|uniref:Amidoligase enzyme-domain-containing protein n=1 Tax=Cytospora mali TaxID=578113 RepID=A0A194VMN6_CYTMA|nr:hypothetical protein VM1G_01254 [Valsa mali]
MGSLNMTSASLQFGIEIELLLGGRKKGHSSWKSIANDLSKRLAAAGIANHINEAGDKAVEHYREWSIVREITIPNQPAKGLWGIEIVSPIYPATWYWATDLEMIFSTLKHSFVIAPSGNCSTHIHVSATPLPLNSMELSSLAKAALYFEPALDQLVPTDRRGSTAYWCQSNRASIALKSLGLGDCLGMIDAAVYLTPPSTASSSSSGGSNSPLDGGPSSSEQAATRAVVETMNLFPAASAYGKAHGKKHNFIRGKVYKWDFTGMLPRSSASSSSSSSRDGTMTPARGTVEFRQPPGSGSAEDAKGWVSLVLAFVAGVTTGSGSSGWSASGGMGVGGEGGSVEELWGVVVSGASVLGWEGVGAADGIFANRGM